MTNNPTTGSANAGRRNGRPELLRIYRRDVRVNLRVTRRELAVLDRAAAAANAKLTTFARRAALDAARRNGNAVYPAR